MVHPSYPTRALGREWRASYRRRARRLLALAGFAVLVITVCLVLAIW